MDDDPSSNEFPQEEPSYDEDSSLADRQERPSLEHLPLELLLEIFAHFDVAESWHPFFGSVRGTGLVKLMLVCRDWHTLICTTAEFWRLIDTTEPLEMISLYLRRSRGCMIDVLVSLLRKNDFDPDPDQTRRLCGAAISLVMPHAARVHSLFVDLSLDEFYLVEPLFEEGLPALRDVSIMPVKRIVKPRHWINLNLSQARQPSLRSLAVRHVRLPPPSEFWHSLRVLKLFGFPDSPSGTMSAWDLLEILQNNPSLEEVHLLASDYMWEPLEGTPSLVAAPKICCPILRTFVFHGPLSFATDLLSELRFPEDIRHVDLRILSPMGRFERALSTAVPRHCRFLLERMSDVSFQTIRAYGRSPAPCQFKLASPSRRAVSNGKFTSITFEYNHAPEPPDPSLPLRCLTRALAWTTVRHLKLTPLPESTEADTYEGFFDSFPSLESLALCPFSLARTRDLLVALQPKRRESDGGLDTPRCPHLMALAIHEGTGTPDRSGDYELLDALLET